jgi:ABC-type polysaccharide/polyol phosphate export permease
VTSGAATTSEETLSPGLLERTLEPETVPEEAAQDEVELIDYVPSLRETLVETWHCRHLFLTMASAALWSYLTKYRLGPTWIVLQTFMGIVGYTLIFGGGVFDVNTPHNMPYFLFIMVGMMGWQLFMSTMIIATRSFLMLGRIARGIHLPLILIPIAGSSRALIRFGLLLFGYLCTILYFYVKKGEMYAQLQPKFLFFSILGLFLCVTLAWGISLWTAPLTAHTRDVRMIIKFALPFWMFITPVLYPIDHLKGNMRHLAELNPLSAPVEMAKVGMLGAGSVRTFAAIWSIALIAAVFASGVRFMNRYGARVVGLRDDMVDDEEMMM